MTNPLGFAVSSQSQSKQRGTTSIRHLEGYPKKGTENKSGYLHNAEEQNDNLRDFKFFRSPFFEEKEDGQEFGDCNTMEAMWKCLCLDGMWIDR